MDTLETVETVDTNTALQWVIEKAFGRLVPDPAELKTVPFSEIRERIHHFQLIDNLAAITQFSSQTIQSHLNHPFCFEQTLFERLKSKPQAQILLGNVESLENLIDEGYTVDKSCIDLAILNNNQAIVDILIERVGLVVNGSHLNVCAHFGYEQLYFSLRKQNLDPNLTTYNAAAVGPSTMIISDISQIIGCTEAIIRDAVKANRTEVVVLMIQDAQKSGIRIDPNLITYPLINGNLELIQLFEELELFQWHEKLYYAAILSGSLDIVIHIESKLDPSLHEDRILDTAHTDRGRKSLLTDDLVYFHQNRKYFSHTMNYAIQSNSIPILEHIYSQDYGLTISNIITAIKQASSNVLFWALDRYKGRLPYYLLAYLSIQSYIPDKLIKVAILFSDYRFQINPLQRLSLDLNRKLNLHTELAVCTKSIEEDRIYDTDYLMNYGQFFQPRCERRVITIVRCWLALDATEDIINLIPHLDAVDLCAITDILFLYGTIHQIRSIYHQNLSHQSPRVGILTELMCYRQLGKLCFVLKYCNLLPSVLELMYGVAVALNDQLLLSLFTGKVSPIPQFKHILLSRNKGLIMSHIQSLLNKHIEDPATIELLLGTDDPEIVSQITISNTNGWSRWAQKRGLDRIVKYLDPNTDKR